MNVKRKYWIFNVLVALLLALSGCSTSGKSAALGGGLGAAAGAGVGAIADPGPDGSHRVRNVLIGTAVGGSLGVGAGLLVHDSNESSHDEGYTMGRDAEKKEKETLANNPGSLQPKLIPAKTEAHWVPDLVRGNTFIPGHFEFQIIEQARWEP